MNSLLRCCFNTCLLDAAGADVTLTTATLFYDTYNDPKLRVVFSGGSGLSACTTGVTVTSKDGTNTPRYLGEQIYCGIAGSIMTVELGYNHTLQSGKLCV